MYHISCDNIKSIYTAIHNGIRQLMHYLISAYIILASVVLPFYFHEGYSRIATVKTDFFYKISIYIGSVLIVLLSLYLLIMAVNYIYTKYTNINICQEFPVPFLPPILPTDIFAVMYVLALIVSFLCSSYREDARFGSEGWYMGFYTQMILFCVYFFISRFWIPRKFIFYLMFSASAVVFLLGYLNRFDIYPFEMVLSSPDFISTIGNMNWYCGYAVTILFAGTALLWQDCTSSLWQKILLMLYVSLGFATLITQGSASGIVTIGILMVVLFCMSVKSTKQMYCYWQIAALFSCACLFTQILRRTTPLQINYHDDLTDLLTTGCIPPIMALVSFSFLAWMRRITKRKACQKKYFRKLSRIITIVILCLLAILIIMIAVNTARPGSLGALSAYPLFTFSDSWGSNRGATWKAGLLCFIEQDFLHKLAGAGPDAMASYIKYDGSCQLVHMITAAFGPDLSLTNAHNEWLTVLVNTGILGLLSFSSLIISAIATLVKNQGRNPIACACGIALSAYTINNVFSFQQILNTSSAFILLGVGMAFHRNYQQSNSR